MGEDVLSLAFAMRIYRMLNEETKAHVPNCGCRACARRRMWAQEALKRASSDLLRADAVRAELARDV
jgi:hypothetical protein